MVKTEMLWRFEESGLRIYEHERRINPAIRALNTQRKEESDMLWAWMIPKRPILNMKIRRICEF